VHAECAEISGKHLKVGIPVLLFCQQSLVSFHPLLFPVRTGLMDFSVMSKDLEDTEYYCPDCKPKFAFEPSYSTALPEVKYVFPRFIVKGLNPTVLQACAIDYFVLILG